MQILVVIPARGGSQGIPRKNVRLIGGRPLIRHAIDLALASRATAVMVTSDDPQILDVAKEAPGVLLRKRPAALGASDVTLDPVIHDAVVAYEQEQGQRVDVVVTLQPTSPLLSAQTLDAALDRFMESDRDSLVSVVEDVHLRWRMTEDEGPRPLYEKRVNRQWLPLEYRETGAFVISQRSVVTDEGRLGDRVDVHPMPLDEALDIDTPLDWFMARALMGRRRFIALVNGNEAVGLGHVYRVLTLADQFLGHDFRIVTWDSLPRVIDLMEQRRHRVEIVDDQEAALRLIETERPDVVINDILDTDLELVERQRAAGSFVVNFEDLGAGSLRANLVVNALYEMSDPPPSHVSGAHYVCLDQNFIIERPAPFRSPAETLLLTYGGADQNNMTLRVVRLLPQLFEQTPLRRAIIVLGPGYAHDGPLEAFLGELPNEIIAKISIHRAVSNMARLIREADVAATSNGGTVYELAAMHVPAVVVSQNDRETSHLWSRYTQGIDYLGMARSVDDQEILRHLEVLLGDERRREKMRAALVQTDIRGGAQRVHDVVLDSYWKWKDAEDPTR